MMTIKDVQVANIAGRILAGVMGRHSQLIAFGGQDYEFNQLCANAVKLARAVFAEVERTALEDLGETKPAIPWEDVAARRSKQGTS